MPKKNCSDCPFRARYDGNPGSILGRLWRWHIKWCPGWKSYIKSLDENEKSRIIEQYKLKF